MHKYFVWFPPILNNWNTCCDLPGTCLLYSCCLINTYNGTITSYKKNLIYFCAILLADDETVTILLGQSIIPLFLQGLCITPIFTIFHYNNLDRNLINFVSCIGLKNSNKKLAEACIRSLRTFYMSQQTPVDPIYEVNICPNL